MTSSFMSVLSLPIRYVVALTSLALGPTHCLADPLPASELFDSLQLEPGFPLYDVPTLSGKPNAKTVVLLLDQHGSPMVEYKRLLLLHAKYGINTVGIEGLVDPANDKRVRKFRNGEIGLIRVLFSTPNMTPNLAIVGLEAAETQNRAHEALAIQHIVQYEDALKRLQAQFPGDAWIDELDEAILNRISGTLQITVANGDAYEAALAKRAEKWTDGDNHSSPIPISKRGDAGDAVAMSVHATQAMYWLRRPYSFVPNAKSFREWQSVLRKKYGDDFERIGHADEKSLYQEFILGPRDKVAVEILDKHMDEHGITQVAVVFGLGHAKGLIKHFKELAYNIIAIEPFEGARGQYEGDHRNWYETPLAEMFPKFESANPIREGLSSIPILSAPVLQTDIFSADLTGIRLPAAMPNDAELRLYKEAGSMPITADKNSN